MEGVGTAVTTLCVHLNLASILEGTAMLHGARHCKDRGMDMVGYHIMFDSPGSRV